MFSHTHLDSSSLCLCQYVCFVWTLQFILLTYSLHQKQSLQRLRNGLILCKCMQITVSQNSIRIGSMQIVFAKQPYCRNLQFPTPSHPTHLSVRLLVQTPYSLIYLTSRASGFFFHTISLLAAPFQ